MTIFETYSDILSDMFIPSDIQSGMKNMTCYDILADIWPRILSGILSDSLSDYFFSGIHSELLFGILFGLHMDMYSYYRNLFDMLSDICSDTLFGIYSYWQSDILSDIYSVMLSGILSDIIVIICGHCICNFIWYSELLTYIRTFYLTSWHYIWHSPESLGATHAPGESERGFANPSVWSFQGLTEFVEYLSGFPVWFVAKQSSSHNFRHVFCSHSDICIIISVA
jgi:hypothetical protein